MTRALRRLCPRLCRVWDDPDMLDGAAAPGTVVLSDDGHVWLYEAIDLWLRTDSEEWWLAPTGRRFRVLHWGRE